MGPYKFVVESVRLRDGFVKYADFIGALGGSETTIKVFSDVITVLCDFSSFCRLLFAKASALVRKIAAEADFCEKVEDLVLSGPGIDDSDFRTIVCDCRGASAIRYRPK